MFCMKVTSEACNMDEDRKSGKTRRRQRSAALSTPPAVHVHIGSDGNASNDSISSRGITATVLQRNKINAVVW